MYKGFFEDVEYVLGLFFKPFEDCCGDDEDDDEEEKKCVMGCDQMPCCRKDDEDSEDGDEKDGSRGGGLLGPGPVQDILKCMFDASDVDYDYED